MLLTLLLLHLLLKCKQSLNLNEGNTTKVCAAHIFSLRTIQSVLFHFSQMNWIKRKSTKNFHTCEMPKTHLRNEGNVFSASLFPLFHLQMLQIQLAVRWVDCHQSNKYWFCEHISCKRDEEKEHNGAGEIMVGNVCLKCWRLLCSKPIEFTWVWKHKEEAPQPHRVHNGNGNRTQIKC